MPGNLLLLYKQWLLGKVQGGNQNSSCLFGSIYLQYKILKSTNKEP